MLGLLIGPLLALALGVRHAFEPDHLAAVSTLVAERARRRGLSIGMMWGIGHAASLLAVAAVLALVEGALSQRASDALELGVAAMLIILGARSLGRAMRLGKLGPDRLHRHGAVVHSHGVSAEHVHVGRHTFATRSLLVGAVHGLAGSGALVAVAMAAMPTVLGRLVYVFMFGVGSIAGMGLVTAIASRGVERLFAAWRLERALLTVAGVSSVVIGLAAGAPLVAALSR